MSLAKRLERLEAGLRARNLGNEPWLVYALHEWAEGCPIGFAEGETEAGIARYRPVALDALVAAGKIGDQHRERVTFITHTIIESPNKNAPIPTIRREDAA